MKRKRPRKPRARKEAEDQGSFGIIAIRDVPDETVFRFQLGPALLDQLRAKLESLSTVPLTEKFDAGYPGFYQLIYRGKPHYIGKTQRTIAARLSEHWHRLRKAGVPLEDLACRFAFVEDLSLIDITEKSLIRYFKDRGEAEWNGTGLGSKVPGYGRRGQRASQFVEQFAPDLDRLVTAGSKKPVTLKSVIRQIDSQAPIHFKIPREFQKKFDSSFASAIRIPVATLSFRDWVDVIQDALGPKWSVDRHPLSWYVVLASSK